MTGTNKLDFDRKFYEGSPSTLCSGCGHDSITNQIISALFQSSVNPHLLAKISGIGCSSKTPTYFSKRSSGFNGVHGRMAPLATGAVLANGKLKIIGISGDGDSASIGLGSFCHLLRRNIPMVYILENNGVYGLTKGQFSATAEENSVLKSGQINNLDSIDLCSLAIEMGCPFVARSFSGDAKQMIPLLRSALAFKGTAFIDVISPCITFSNHEGATKSYSAVKDRKIQLQKMGFIESREEITVDYQDSTLVEMHDGSVLSLTKVNNQHDVFDRFSALKQLSRARQKGQFLTGLFYLDRDQKSFIDKQNLVEASLCSLNEKHLKPSPALLDEILEEFT